MCIIPELNFRKEKMLVQSLHYECKADGCTLICNAHGLYDKALSPSYYDALEHSTYLLQQTLLTLRKFTECKLNVFVNVKEDGALDLEHISIIINKTWKDAVVKKQYVSQVVAEIERLLVFAELMKNVTLVGFKEQLSNCQVEMIASLEDIVDILHNPFISPRSQIQWTDACRDFISHAQRYFKSSQFIPVLDGELMIMESRYHYSTRMVVGRASNE